MTSVSAGKDVISYCNRCKSSLAHIVVVMLDETRPDRVQCNTCKTIHKFKDPSSVSAKTKKPTARVSKKRQAEDNKKLTGKAMWENSVNTFKGDRTSYSPKSTYIKGDQFDHPSFGVGIVTKLVDNNKIEVIFQADIKTLMHNLKK